MSKRIPIVEEFGCYKKPSIFRQFNIGPGEDSEC